MKPHEYALAVQPGFHMGFKWLGLNALKLRDVAILGKAADPFSDMKNIQDEFAPW